LLRLLPVPTPPEAGNSLGSGATIATSSTVNPLVPFHKVRRALPQFRIAERRPTSFAHFSVTPSRCEPDLALTRAEIDDLVGYIETLR
jgi:hypothetical protein